MYVPFVCLNIATAKEGTQEARQKKPVVVSELELVGRECFEMVQTALNLITEESVW
jgi:hypothetical protein